jgi:hypothetical protein
VWYSIITLATERDSKAICKAKLKLIWKRYLWIVFIYNWHFYHIKKIKLCFYLLFIIIVWETLKIP